MTKKKRRTQVYKPPYDPTPEEIREVCAEIRAGWSEERWAKAERGRVRWVTPNAKHPRLSD